MNLGAAGDSSCTLFVIRFMEGGCARGHYGLHEGTTEAIHKSPYPVWRCHTSVGI